MTGGNIKQVESNADENMDVHSKLRRNSESKPFDENTALPLPAPRSRSRGGTRLSCRGSEPPGLQVLGSCCPLQQRPDSGRLSRGGGDVRLIVLCSLRGRLESRAEPASRTRTGNRPVMTLQGGAATVHHHRDQVTEAETSMTLLNHESQAHHGQPGAIKNSELHLYLPSSLCEDEDQDSETEEMRSMAETDQEPDVKPNNPSCPMETS